MAPANSFVRLLIVRVLTAAAILFIEIDRQNSRHALAQDSPSSGRLLIAYGSYKDRGKYPTITFYEHDGLADGKIVGTIPPVDLRSDSHPSLSHDGRFCAFTSELENQTSRILLWDLKAKQLIDLPVVNDSPNSQQHATLSGDSRFLSMSTWNRPGTSNRWDVLVFDIASKTVPGISATDPSSLLSPWNAAAVDERMPTLSADGNLLSFVTNAPDGEGVADIALWDRMEGRSLPLLNLNSPHREIEPSLSADGRWIAFISDRPGGAGARDVYVYDRRLSQIVAVPGLNSVAHEQMPGISPDGRYIVFVSERRAGAGERDIFIYDRSTERLLPTPNMNSAREEIDPCVIVLRK